MSESMIQMQRKLVDVTSKLEKAERELAEVQATLARLAQQKPFGRYVKIVDPVDKNKHTYGVDYYSGFYVADLLDKEVYAAPAHEQREGKLAVAAPAEIIELSKKYAIDTEAYHAAMDALLQSTEGCSSQAQNRVE